MKKKRVLILCTANSARSQMAEGVLRHLAGDRYHVFSAGTRATRVNPHAVSAMAAIGVDISEQTSKTLDQFVNQPFDAVITVCDNAAEGCPFISGVYNRVHWSFPDPAAELPADQPRAFAEVRDGLLVKFSAWLKDEAG